MVKSERCTVKSERVARAVVSVALISRILFDSWRFGGDEWQVGDNVSCADRGGWVGRSETYLVGGGIFLFGRRRVG